MTIGWGWKIGLGYGGFVAMIICLVVASGHQKIDLVSKDYYKDEIGYQQVLDASKNEAQLAGSMIIRAGKQELTIDFPAEFMGKSLVGTAQLYSAVNKDWDRSFAINTKENKLIIPLLHIQPTRYTIKISYVADGKSYYYETEADLHTP